VKKPQLLILLFFFKVSAQYNQEERIEDFNNDGVKDTLQSYYDGGSAFGSTYVKIIDGKSN